MTGPVLVVGDVVTDVTVRLGGPVHPDADTAATISLQGGGSGANLAAWLAAAGVDVDFVARVGAGDAAGHAAELAAAGVRPHLAVDPTRHGGTVVVLVAADGGRTMLTDRGANAGLSPADLPPEVLAHAAHLHLSGYALLTGSGRDTVRAVLDTARTRGTDVSVDPGSASFLAGLGAAEFHRLVAGTTLLVPNLDEARLLAGDGGPDALARRLAERYPLVVLTLGEAGAVVARTGGPPVRLPAVRTTVVDTTGAGDALLAGFLAARLAGADDVDCLRAGLRLAATAVRRSGARPPPTGNPPTAR